MRKRHGHYHFEIGRKFNLLTVVRKVPRDEEIPKKIKEKRRPLWECRCDCGGTTFLIAYQITRGLVKSCGCLYTKSNYHASEKSLTYRSWMAMKVRCYSKKHIHYKNYGGRGITVCDQWRHAFSRFILDVGERPSKNHQLERINNDGNYEPGNVRWATIKDQNYNKRSNRMITYGGKTQCVKQWSIELGMPYYLILRRLNKWSIKDAFEKKNQRPRTLVRYNGEMMSPTALAGALGMKLWTVRRCIDKYGPEQCVTMLLSK